MHSVTVLRGSWPIIFQSVVGRNCITPWEELPEGLKCVFCSVGDTQAANEVRNLGKLLLVDKSSCPLGSPSSLASLGKGVGTGLDFGAKG
jgi:hypothetical protein